MQYTKIIIKNLNSETIGKGLVTLSLTPLGSGDIKPNAIWPKANSLTHLS